MVYYRAEKGETTCSCGKPGPTWRLDTIYIVTENKKKISLGLSLIYLKIK